MDPRASMCSERSALKIALASLHLCSLSPIEDHISLLLVSRAAAVLAPQRVLRVSNVSTAANCGIACYTPWTFGLRIVLHASSASTVGHFATHSSVDLNHSVLDQNILKFVYIVDPIAD
jgi:hypothetical protein